jgi:hypothetical protein
LIILVESFLRTGGLEKRPCFKPLITGVGRKVD